VTRAVASIRLVALCALACGCQDVSIGRQLPGDPDPDVVQESVIPTPDGAVTLRALEVGPGGEIVVLLQLEGTVDFGDSDPRTSTSEGGDGVLLVLEADGSLRAKRVVSAGFLTLYRAALDRGLVHVAGHFRGALSDGDALGDSPTSQTAVALTYDLDAERVSARTLASASGFGNVQGKGIDARGDARLRCGNYLDQIDAGDGPIADADIAGDNAYVTVADAAGTRWTRALVSPEGPGVRGVYGQSCAFGPDGGVFAALDFDASVELDGVERTADAYDALVVAYSPDGAVRWDATLSGAGDQELNPIAASASRVLVGGRSTAPFDWAGESVAGRAFVAALDLDGAPAFAWSVGESGPHAVTALDATGSTAVASGFFGAPVEALGWAHEGDRDGFVLGLDDAGAVSWSRTFGGPGPDACLGHLDGARLVAVCTFGAALVSPGGTPIPDGGALWVGRLTL